MKAFESSATQQAITDAIATELLKRGFTARLSVERKTSRSGNEYLEITSAPFQTVPVIMKEIFIDSRIDSRADGEGFKVGGRVGVRYNHFGGGSNGTELFHFSCVVFPNREDVYDIAVR